MAGIYHRKPLNKCPGETPGRKEEECAVKDVCTGSRHMLHTSTDLLIHVIFLGPEKMKSGAGAMCRGRRRVMFCPYCNSSKFTRTDTRYMADGRVFRRNKCLNCGKKFNTYECYVPDGEKPCPRMFRKNGVRMYRRGKSEAIHKSHD